MTEEVTYAACTDADEHLHEIRAAHREERYIGFAGYGLGKEGFTGTRRAHEKCAFRDFSTYLGIFLGILEELDDFLHLLFGAV